MVTFKSAILAASTAPPGSRVRDHIRSLSPGVRTGEITIEQAGQIVLSAEPGTMLIFSQKESLEIAGNEGLEINQPSTMQINK